MIRLYTRKTNLAILGVIIFILLFPVHSLSQNYQLAILPLTIKAEQDLSSQNDEIINTLSTLLSKKDTLTIINPGDVEKEIDTSEDYTDESNALIIGEKLQADFVISGSLAISENNITISLNLADVSGIMPPQNYKADIQELAHVLPQITAFATIITGQILNTETAASLLPEKEDKAEKVKTDTKPGKTEDMKASQDDTYITKEPWTSKILNVGIIGMSLGDVDNDKKTELVILTPNKVQTFHYVDGKIVKAKDIHKTRFKFPVGIDVADINGNGFPEIFVTALDNYKSVVTSFILEYDGKSYQMIENNYNCYLRIHFILNLSNVKCFWVI